MIFGKSKLYLLSSLLLLVLCPCLLGAEEENISVSLVSEVSTVTPGKSFSLGVLFKIKHPWHLYWKNPGQAGLPSRAKFILPEGFTQSLKDYPLPKSFEQIGGLLGYGYEEELLLVSEIMPPPQLEYGKAYEFKAEVRWLGCLDVCVPGNRDLSLSLVASGESVQTQRDVFLQWEKRLPRDYSSAESHFKYHFKDLGDYSYLVHVDWPVAPVEQNFFVGPTSGFKLKDSNLKLVGNISEFTFSLEKQKPDAALAMPLELLVVFQVPGSEKLGIKIELGVR